MTDAPRDALRDIISAYDSGLLKFPNRIDSLLRGMCPDDDKEIRIIVFLASRGLPLELLSAEDPGEIQSKFMMMLTMQMGYNEATALWGIKAWAYALDIDLPEYIRKETAPVVVKKPKQVVKAEPAKKPERIVMAKGRAVADSDYVQEKKPLKLVDGTRVPLFKATRDGSLLLYSFCISFIALFLFSQFILRLNGAIPYLFIFLILAPALSIILIMLYHRLTKSHLYKEDPGPQMFGYDDLKIGAIAIVLLIIGMVFSSVIRTSLLFLTVSEVYTPLTGGAFFAAVLVLVYSYTRNTNVTLALGMALSLMDMILRVWSGGFVGFSIFYMLAALILASALRKLEDGGMGVIKLVAASALFSLSLIAMNQLALFYYQGPLIDGPFAISLVVTAILCAVYIILWSVVLMAEGAIRARMP